MLFLWLTFIDSKLDFVRNFFFVQSADETRFYSFKIRLLLVNTNSKIVKKISAEIVIIIIGAVFDILALTNIIKAKDSSLRIPLGEILEPSNKKY